MFSLAYLKCDFCDRNSKQDNISKNIIYSSHAPGAVKHGFQFVQLVGYS
jgi:hypothetical protein